MFLVEVCVSVNQKLYTTKGREEKKKRGKGWRESISAQYLAVRNLVTF